MPEKLTEVLKLCDGLKHGVADGDDRLETLAKAATDVREMLTLEAMETMEALANQLRNLMFSFRRIGVNGFDGELQHMLDTVMERGNFLEVLASNCGIERENTDECKGENTDNYEEMEKRRKEKKCDKEPGPHCHVLDKCEFLGMTYGKDDNGNYVPGAWYCSVTDKSTAEKAGVLRMAFKI
jgi:hypothetical protein